MNIQLPARYMSCIRKALVKQRPDGGQAQDNGGNRFSGYQTGEHPPHRADERVQSQTHGIFQNEAPLAQSLRSGGNDIGLLQLVEKVRPADTYGAGSACGADDYGWNPDVFEQIDEFGKAPGRLQHTREKTAPPHSGQSNGGQ